MFSPEIGPELAFIGFVQPATGGILSMSELQAQWLAMIIKGRAKLPSRAFMNETRIKDKVEALLGICFIETLNGILLFILHSSYQGLPDNTEVTNLYQMETGVDLSLHIKEQKKMSQIKLLLTLSIRFFFNLPIYELSPHIHGETSLSARLSSVS